MIKTYPIKCNLSVIESIVKNVRSAVGDEPGWLLFSNLLQGIGIDSAGKHLLQFKDWKRGKDVTMKTGRFLRRFYWFLSDEQIAEATNKINAELWPDITIDIKRGQALVDAYNNDKPRSCMTGKSRLTNFYAINEDKIGLAYCVAGGHRARSLVWDVRVKNDGGEYETKVFGDRVYETNSIAGYALKQYLENKCDFCRHRDTLPPMQVRLKENTIRAYPYADTMIYLREKGDGTVVLFNKSTYRYDYVIQNTEGYLEDEDACYCYSCEEPVNEDCSYEVGDYIYCETCYHNRFFVCYHCEEATNTDEAVWCDENGEYYCDYCASRHLHTCDNCEKYFLSDDDHAAVDDRVYCTSCAEEKLEVCQGCDEYGIRDDMKELDDDYYCEECYGPAKESLSEERNETLFSGKEACDPIVYGDCQQTE